MAAQVVHRNQRQICGEGKSLCEIHADKQRADQARRVGDGDRVDFGKRQRCAAECLAHHADNRFAVPAGGDLRHDAAV